MLQKYYTVSNLLDNGTTQLWEGRADDIEHARGLAKADIEGVHQIHDELYAFEQSTNTDPAGSIRNT